MKPKPTRKKQKSRKKREIEVIRKIFLDIKNDPKTMKQIREKLLKPIEA